MARLHDSSRRPCALARLLRREGFPSACPRVQFPGRAPLLGAPGYSGTDARGASPDWRPHSHSCTGRACAVAVALALSGPALPPSARKSHDGSCAVGAAHGDRSRRKRCGASRGGRGEKDIWIAGFKYIKLIVAHRWLGGARRTSRMQRTSGGSLVAPRRRRRRGMTTGWRPSTPFAPCARCWTASPSSPP